MRSAPGLRPPPGEVVTARSRIRDAALHRFAAAGFAGASVRGIADDAGVSPALVMHHFGSKAGLRTACDEHLVATLTATKRDAIEAPMTASGLLAELEGAGDLVAYLGRALTDGSTHAATLFDSMVAMSQELMEQAVATGMIRSCSDPRARAALLTTWQMSLLALGHHLARALGEPIDTPAGLLRIERAAVEVYTNGLFTDDRFVGLVEEADRQLGDRGTAPAARPESRPTSGGEQ
jgi:AcrR family transcriptional regulator